MSFRSMRCRECGRGRVRSVAKSGRFQRYQGALLRVPAKLKIPTCDACGEEWVDGPTAEKLESALSTIYRKRAAQIIARAMKAVRHYARQKSMSLASIEALLGMSTGYLSRLRAERREPSAALVNELALIGKDPRRLRELEKVWEQ